MSRIQFERSVPNKFSSNIKQQQQQQHSLFSQASWDRLEMKPKRNKFKVQAQFSCFSSFTIFLFFSTFFFVLILLIYIFFQKGAHKNKPQKKYELNWIKDVVYAKSGLCSQMHAKLVGLETQFCRSNFAILIFANLETLGWNGSKIFFISL